jgi:hypothetical protein
VDSGTRGQFLEGEMEQARGVTDVHCRPAVRPVPDEGRDLLVVRDGDEARTLGRVHPELVSMIKVK